MNDFGHILSKEKYELMRLVLKRKMSHFVSRGNHRICALFLKCSSNSSTAKFCRYSNREKNHMKRSISRPHSGLSSDIICITKLVILINFPSAETKCLYSSVTSKFLSFTQLYNYRHFIHYQSLFTFQLRNTYYSRKFRKNCVLFRENHLK